MTRIVDAHVHVWDPHRFHYPWLEATPALNAACLPGDIPRDRDSAGMLFVEADRAAEQGHAEAAWVAEMGDRWPDLLGIVAFAPLEHGPAVAEELAELSAMGKVVGVRRLLQDETADFVTDAALIDGVRSLACTGLSFDACVRHSQLPALVTLRRTAPETTVVLDHLGKPPIRAGWNSTAASEWLRAVEALAAEPLTYVKLSGLAPEAGPGSLSAQAAPFLIAAVEAFGPERAMLASDWPVSQATEHHLTRQAWFDLVHEVLQLDASEIESVDNGAARSAYGLKVHA